MTYRVPIQGAEASHTEVELAGFFSGAKLLVNGKPAPKAEKRGEYVIIADDGSRKIAKLKNKFLDPVPSVIVDGREIKLVKPLQWYQWIWAGLPILLIFIGGALGAMMGILATSLSTRIFRSDAGAVAQYIQVALVSVGAVVGYVVLAMIFFSMVG